MSNTLRSAGANDTDRSVALTEARKLVIANEKVDKADNAETQVASIQPPPLPEFVYSEEAVMNAKMPTSAEELKEVREVMKQISTNVFTSAAKGELDALFSEFLVDRAKQQKAYENTFNEILRKGDSDAYFRAIADGVRVGESFVRSLNAKDVNANNELYLYLKEQTNAHVRPVNEGLADDALKELETWYNYDKEVAREIGRVMEVLNGDSMRRLLASIPEVPEDTMVLQVTPKLYGRLMNMLLGATANMTLPMRRFTGFINEAFKLTDRYVPIATPEVMAVLNPALVKMSPKERAQVLKDAEEQAENSEAREAATSIVSPLGIAETYFLPDTIGHVETLNPVELRFVQASLKADMILRSAVELIGNIDTASVHTPENSDLLVPPDSTDPIGKRNMLDVMGDAMQHVEKQAKTAAPHKGNYTSPTAAPAKEKSKTEAPPIGSKGKFETLQEKRMAAKLDKLPASMRTMAASYAEAARQSLDGRAKDDKKASEQAEGQLPFINKTSKLIMGQILGNDKDSIGAECIDAIARQIKETNSKNTLAAIMGESTELYRSVVADVMEKVNYHQDPTGAYKKENAQATLDVLELLVSSVLHKDDNVISERMSDAEKRQVRDHVARHLRIRKKARRLVIVRSTAAQVSLGSDPMRHDSNDEDETVWHIEKILMMKGDDMEDSPRLSASQPLRHKNNNKRPYNEKEMASMDDDADISDDDDDENERAPDLSFLDDVEMDDAGDDDDDDDAIVVDGDEGDVNMFDAPSIRQPTQAKEMRRASPFKKARIDASDATSSFVVPSRNGLPPVMSAIKKKETAIKRTRSTAETSANDKSDEGAGRVRRRGANIVPTTRTSVAGARVGKSKVTAQEDRAVTRRSIRGGLQGAAAQRRETARIEAIKKSANATNAKVPAAAGKSSEVVAAAIRASKKKAKKVAGKDEKELTPEEAQKAFEELPWSEQYLASLKTMDMTTYDAVVILSLATTMAVGTALLLNTSTANKDEEATAADALSINLFSTLEKRTALTSDHMVFSDQMLRGVNSVAAASEEVKEMLANAEGAVKSKVGKYTTRYETMQNTINNFFKAGEENIKNLIASAEYTVEQGNKNIMRLYAQSNLMAMYARTISVRMIDPATRTAQSIEAEGANPTVSADQLNIARTTPIINDVPSIDLRDFDYTLKSYKELLSSVTDYTPPFIRDSSRAMVDALEKNELVIKDDATARMALMQQAAENSLHAGMSYVPELNTLADRTVELASGTNQLLTSNAMAMGALLERKKIATVQEMEGYIQFIGARVQELRQLVINPKDYEEQKRKNQETMQALTTNIDKIFEEGQKKGVDIKIDTDRLRSAINREERAINIQLNLLDLNIRENALAMDKYMNVVWLNYRKSVFDTEETQRNYKAMEVEKQKEDGAGAAAVLAAGGAGMTWGSMNFLSQSASRCLRQLDRVIDLNRLYMDVSRISSRAWFYANDDFTASTIDPNNKVFLNRMVTEGWIYKTNATESPGKPEDFTLESMCSYSFPSSFDAVKEHEKKLPNGQKLTIAQSELYADKYLTHITALQAACADIVAKESDELLNDAITNAKSALEIDNARMLSIKAHGVATKIREHYNTMVANKSLGVIAVDGATSMLRFLNTTRYGASALKNVGQMGMLVTFSANIAFKGLTDKLRSINKNKTEQEKKKSDDIATELLQRRKRANDVTVILNGKATNISMGDVVATTLETIYNPIALIAMDYCKSLYDSGRFLEETLDYMSGSMAMAKEVRDAAEKGGEVWEKIKAERIKGTGFRRNARILSVDLFRGMLMALDGIGYCVGSVSTEIIYQIDRNYEKYGTSHGPKSGVRSYWNAFWTMILKKDYALKLAVPAYFAFQYKTQIDMALYGLTFGTTVGVAVAPAAVTSAVTMGVYFAAAVMLIPAYYFMETKFGATAFALTWAKRAVKWVHAIVNKIDEAVPGFKYFIALPSVLGLVSLSIGCLGMFTSLAMFAARQCINLALSTSLRALCDFFINRLMRVITGNNHFEGKEEDMKTLTPSQQFAYISMKLLSAFGTRFVMMRLNYITELKFMYQVNPDISIDSSIRGTMDITPVKTPETYLADALVPQSKPSEIPWLFSPEDLQPSVTNSTIVEIITNKDPMLINLAEANKVLQQAKAQFEPYADWLNNAEHALKDLLALTTGTPLGLSARRRN